MPAPTTCSRWAPAQSSSVSTQCQLVSTSIIWNLGTPEFIYEFMKHRNSYMKKSNEFIVCNNFV